jgi:hypothetical protein
MPNSICTKCGIDFGPSWRYCPKCGIVAPRPKNEEEESLRYKRARIRCNTCKKERQTVCTYIDSKVEVFTPSYCIACGDTLEIVSPIVEEPFFNMEIRRLRGREIKLALPPEIIEKIRERFKDDSRVLEILGPYKAKKTYFYVLEVTRGSSPFEMKDALRSYVGTLGK